MSNTRQLCGDAVNLNIIFLLVRTVWKNDAFLFIHFLDLFFINWDFLKRHQLFTKILMDHFSLSFEEYTQFMKHDQDFFFQFFFRMFIESSLHNTEFLFYNYFSKFLFIASLSNFILLPFPPSDYFKPHINKFFVLFYEILLKHSQNCSALWKQKDFYLLFEVL